MKSYLRYLGLVGFVLLMGSSCAKKNDTKDLAQRQQDPAPPIDASVEMKCGTNVGRVYYRTLPATGVSPQNKPAYLIQLSGSPGTEYFSEQGSEYSNLTNRFRENGYTVFEAKYEENGKDSIGYIDGYYSLCEKQTTEEQIHHMADLYDLASKVLDLKGQPTARVAGLGLSLGAVQLEMMSYDLNKHFTDLAFLGTLLGSAQKGCLDTLKVLEIKEKRKAKMALDRSEELKLSLSYSWDYFMGYVHLIFPTTIDQNDFATAKAAKCLDLGTRLDADKLRHFADKSNERLGIFEGTNMAEGGSPMQANYLWAKKKAIQVVSNDVVLQSYGCGHWVLEGSKCNESDKAQNDVFEFLKN